MSRFVYLARPIDQAASSPKLANLTVAVFEALRDAGFGVYRPHWAFAVPKEMEPGSEIEAINRAALRECCALLAILPAGTPTIGVPMEIEQARQAGKPVAVLTDLTSAAWSLRQPGVQTFGLDAYGIRHAAKWLAAQRYARAESRDPLPFAPTGDGGQLPTRAYPDDAGLDLAVSAETLIPSGQFRDVPCSVAVQMESHHWGLVIGRSSTLRKRGLMVNPGIIDPGYRGELYAGCFNLGREPVALKVGERVAQLILMRNETQAVLPVWVEALAASDRGTAGFGSSGV